MAEEPGNPEGRSAASERAADPVALSFALGAAAHSERVAAKAETFLEEHTILTRLQAKDLAHELSLHHWSLRVRHLSDVLKLAFELAAAAIVTTVVVFIGAAVWRAAHDHALVIEAFNVPTDMAARGLTGQVVATQLQDRLAWMQSQTDTIRQADTFRNNWANDIKVQIPDTGISIGEFYGSLAGWLGNETHITGEVWRSATMISLSVRSGEEPARTFTAAESDLGKLIARAAEEIYRVTQPYRYGIFLDQHNRSAESVAVMRALAQSGPVEERPWALSRLGFFFLENGNPRGAVEANELAVSLNPNLPHVWGNLAASEAYFGHDEAMLRDSRRSVALLERPETARSLASYAAIVDMLGNRGIVAKSLGDYREAIADEMQVAKQPSYSESDTAAPVMISEALAWNHDVAASRRWDTGKVSGEISYLPVFASTNGTALVPPLPSFARAAATEAWPRARDDLAAFLRVPEAKVPAVATVLPAAVWPWLAYAEAMNDDFTAARALIDKTLPDCYLCLRMRGNIDAAAKDWSGAGRWFTEAVKQAPSIPFAYTDWGAMLLREGKYNAAIAKFREANLKGPHFADPLEMWGEVLMMENRSDLALAKFEEANKYAPNWGRLHLKWGQALSYVGKRDEAKKQFGIASTLDLSAADKASVANWMNVHG